MARIPRAQEMGLGDDTAQVTRGVVNVPTIDQSGARTAATALDQVGGQLREFGQRLHQAEVDRSVAEANIGATNDLDKLKRRLAESQADPTTYETTYAEESGRIIEAWGQKVPGGGRDMWMQRAKEGQLRDTIEVRNLTRQRQLEGEQAKGIAIFENIKDRAGDASLSPAAYGEMQTQGRQLVADQLATGVITKDVAQRYLVELDNAQVADNTARWQSNFDALATQGKIAEAEEWRNTQMGLNKLGQSIVDPKVLEASKKALDTAKPKYAADAAATDIYNRSRAKDGSFDFAAGIAEARRISDPMVRDLAIQQLGQMVAQDKVAHEQEQDAAAKDLFEWTKSGRDPTKAPPSLLGRFDNASRMASSISLYNSMQAEKGMTEAQKTQQAIDSAVAVAGFDSLARRQPSLFMQGLNAWPKEYQDAYKSMKWQDQIALSEKVNKMIETGPTSDAVDKVLQDVTKEAARFAPSIMNVAANDQGGKERKLQFEGFLYKHAANLSKDQGGQPITPDQAKKIVLRAMGDLDAKKYGEGVNMALGFDADVYRRVRDALAAKLGEEPSRQAVYEAYKSAMAD